MKSNVQSGTRLCLGQGREEVRVAGRDNRPLETQSVRCVHADSHILKEDAALDHDTATRSSTKWTRRRRLLFGPSDHTRRALEFIFHESFILITFILSFSDETNKINTRKYYIYQYLPIGTSITLTYKYNFVFIL